MRLIDADWLMRSFQVDMCGSFTCHECPLWNDDEECGFEIFISDTPTVDAVPVVHGRWIESPDNDGMDYECSNLKCKCRISYNGSRVSGDFNYCPNCGAKMDEVRK